MKAFTVQSHCSRAVLVQAFAATLIDSIHKRRWVGVTVCTQQPKTMLSFHMCCVCVSVCLCAQSVSEYTNGIDMSHHSYLPQTPCTIESLNCNIAKISWRFRGSGFIFPEWTLVMMHSLK